MQITLNRVEVQAAINAHLASVLNPELNLISDSIDFANVRTDDAAMVTITLKSTSDGSKMDTPKLPEGAVYRGYESKAVADLDLPEAPEETLKDNTDLVKQEPSFMDTNEDEDSDDPLSDQALDAELPPDTPVVAPSPAAPLSFN